MANLHYLINHFLGKYGISQNINKVKIQGRAIYFEPRNKAFWWFSLPTKPGIYYYRNNKKEYYICRTRIGFLFPSLYRLVLEPKTELVPHPIRWGFGCFLVLWIILAIIPIVYIAFTEQLHSFIGIVFWGLLVFVLFLLFEFDKQIALRGFINQ